MRADTPGLPWTWRSRGSGGSWGLGVCAATAAALLCVCGAFNLDTRFSAVKERETPGALFGLSVALHQQVKGVKKAFLLVGAPKEKADPNVYTKTKANHTGDMFACPITTNPRDCKRLNLISSDVDSLGISDGVIEDMWLGVSVVSQDQPGGRVMACGHRYSRRMDSGSNLRMIGKCYIRGNDFTYDLDNDFQWQDIYEVCDPTGDQIGEGMCNMGISAVMTQTDVVVGAPGCYNWQGNPYVIYRDPHDKYTTQKYKFANPKANLGNMYTGYSVAIDRAVLSKDADTVVSGAPRSASKGSVILAMKVVNANYLTSKVILMGQQIGSYFGNSIAVVDLNSDGWKDIIVGAPFYFERSNETGGAVYVFMNENGSFKEKADQRFTGPKHSGFGMAVAAIGDVNQDGFQDFAVGAPFDGTGRVFVWMGSKGPISDKPSQVIEGKDVTNGGFRTFGYSISGGLDVDDNGYPDVVVGSLDDRVALLRARPVIHLKKTFSVTPSVVDPNNCDSCIKVELCFSYTISTGNPNFKNTITLRFTVKADVAHRSSRSRVFFLNGDKDTYSGTLSMPSNDCQTLQVNLRKPIQDKVTPLLFSLNASLLEPEVTSQQQLQNLDAFPVVSQQEALTDTAEIHFHKACGSDNKCESNLQMTAMFARTQQEVFPGQHDKQVLLYDSSINKLFLLVNVTNTGAPGRKAEDAHNTLLNVTIPPSLTYSGIRPETTACSVKDSDLLCELGNPFAANQTAEIAIIFETLGISLDTREIESVLQLSTLSEQNDLRPLTKVLVVEYVLQTSFLYVPVQPIEFSGHVVGESAMKNTSDIGTPVEFKFIVNMMGKPLGSLGFLQVVFEWPSEVKNGKWLLYLSEIQTNGVSDSHCEPGDVVNPLHLKVSEREARTRRRRRRDEGSVESVGSEPRASHIQQGVQKKLYQLSCAAGARCQTFSCPLYNMSNKAEVTVRARLWNSTMLEDYRDASEIVIYGQATLKLVTDKPTIRMANQTVVFSVRVSPTLQSEVVSEAPLWIIIVSAVAGVLLLALIVLLLWKCGFFRRASTRELYEAKAQKAEMKIQPSENDRLTEEE